jgi:hypothetical protein
MDAANLVVAVLGLAVGIVAFVGIAGITRLRCDLPTQLRLSGLHEHELLIEAKIELYNNLALWEVQIDRLAIKISLKSQRLTEEIELLWQDFIEEENIAQPGQRPHLHKVPKRSADNLVVSRGIMNPEIRFSANARILPGEYEIWVEGLRRGFLRKDILFTSKKYALFLIGKNLLFLAADESKDKRTDLARQPLILLRENDTYRAIRTPLKTGSAFS